MKQISSCETLGNNTESMTSLLITGLKHHNNEKSIKVKRLGAKRNITIILKRKEPAAILQSKI